jgi:hypothetical protein
LSEFRKFAKIAKELEDNSNDPLWSIFSLGDVDNDNQLSKDEWLNGYLTYDSEADPEAVK